LEGVAGCIPGAIWMEERHGLAKTLYP
jgi:hypothetical protein